MDYRVTKDPSGFYHYDPERAAGTWEVEVEFGAYNLTFEQVHLARKIIDDSNKGYGFSVILDALAHAGFCGRIESRMQLNLPLRIVIDSKIETGKEVWQD